MGKRSIRAGFNSNFLKEPLLPFSMLLIFSYLYCNAIYEGYSINDNVRNGDCCIPKDKLFYRLIFWIHSGLWGFLVLYVYSIHCWKCGNDIDDHYFLPFTNDYEIVMYVLLNTIFGSLRFFSSLFLLPLLFLQMLSCYQWTCLFSEYCGSENQYRLSLTQAVISFCFILSGFLISFSAKVAAKPAKTIYATLKLDSKNSTDNKENSTDNIEL